MEWHTESYQLSGDISQINGSDRIPVKLTRRHCVGKVAEVYDLLGKLMPIIAPMKLDLRTLVQCKLSRRHVYGYGISVTSVGTVISRGHVDTFSLTVTAKVDSRVLDVLYYIVNGYCSEFM